MKKSLNRFKALMWAVNWPHR